jgi:phosphoglycerate kinase
MTMIRSLDGADLSGKRALVRVDFNVPMADGRVSDDTRLKSALPTIEALREAGAKIILLAHFDRPKGKRVPSMSLQPVAAPLGALVGTTVAFSPDTTGEKAKKAVSKMKPGDVLLLENTRFHPGEEANDAAFAAELAELGDVYVNDAFSAAHRAHASTEGLARLLPSYAGKALEREIDHLTAALDNPGRPLLAVVGGAKVSTKIDLLKNLVTKVDRLFVGGAMATPSWPPKARTWAPACTRRTCWAPRGRSWTRRRRRTARSCCPWMRWWRASSSPAPRAGWRRSTRSRATR